MELNSLPRYPLAALPTPVQKLDRLSEQLGLELWLKRDDLTGLAFGGNKTRKLELLLADAQAQGAQTVLTTGAIQSNHCRQTAAAAARAGLDGVLLLGGARPETPRGNVLLDRLLGAEIIWIEPQDRDPALAETFEQLVHAGRKPYLIPYGGSNPLGVSAFALALEEFLAQGIEVDRIVIASSSGGTQAGLILGASIFGFQGQILGISVDPKAEVLREIVSGLLAETGAFLGMERLETVGRVDVVDRYLGGGYAVVGDLERAALARFARTEGVLLDPVYTARAAGGLLDLIERGEIERGERILFWHTGGTPALFADPGQVL